MIAKTIIIVWTLLNGFTFFYGLLAVHDTGVSPDSGTFAFVVMASAILHFFTWAIIAVPTYMISRMFAQRRMQPEMPGLTAPLQHRRRLARP